MNNGQNGQADPASPSKEELECAKLIEEREKIRAERDKVGLEIAELRRAWWKRPNYLQALLPLSLVIVSSISALILSWSNGFFDQKRIQLQRDKLALHTEILDYQAQRDDLSKEVAGLRSESASLRTSVHNAAQVIVDLSRKDPRALQLVLKNDLAGRCAATLSQEIDNVRSQTVTPKPNPNSQKH